MSSSESSQITIDDDVDLPSDDEIESLDAAMLVGPRMQQQRVLPPPPPPLPPPQQQPLLPPQPPPSPPQQQPPLPLPSPPSQQQQLPFGSAPFPNVQAEVQQVQNVSDSILPVPRTVIDQPSPLSLVQGQNLSEEADQPPGKRTRLSYGSSPGVGKEVVEEDTTQGATPKEDSPQIPGSAANKLDDPADAAKGPSVGP